MEGEIVGERRSAVRDLPRERETPPFGCFGESLLGEPGGRVAEEDAGAGVLLGYGDEEAGEERRGDVGAGRGCGDRFEEGCQAILWRQLVVDCQAERRPVDGFEIQRIFYCDFDVRVFWKPALDCVP